MDMKNNPINDLPQNEWDALILSILKPFVSLCSKDALVSVEDLQQEAWIALLAASQRFDPRLAKFTTYAYHYIRGHVMRYIRKKTSNKPTQVIDDPIDVDERGYTDDHIERDDCMSVIMSNVSDQQHAELLVEHFVYGLSFRKMAKNHGVSHETIASRVNKLLDLLHIRMSHENS